jgi:hypothetical protein
MPSLKLGNNNVTTVKIGSTQVNKVYLGATEIWSSFVPSDPNAATYINTMNALPGVTLSTTEQQAIDELFIRMKGNDPLYSNFGDAGIWNAAKAIYPYLGSNLEAYRYNAMFPVAATQSTDNGGYPNSPGYQYIAGGVTVDGIYGPKGNGVNGVILTNLNWISGHASALSPTSLSMGAVYKSQAPTGRDDFGDYNPFVNEAGIFLSTGPTTPNARLSCLDGAVSGPNLVPGGKGHWMLHRSGADRRVYYQGVQQTYAGGQNRTVEGSPSYGGIFTWAFLGLNFSAFQYYNGIQFTNSATRAARCVNFSGNTLMFNYIMTGFSNTLIPAWNQMVEAFCVKTGKKTW